MAINCKAKNPLQRDGTNRAQRTLKTLLPGYVAVDERSMEDLKAFAVKYAEEIAFYDTDKNRQGTWKEFFEKEPDTKEKLTSPHYALFLAFLHLFKHAQDEINKITQEHLDFYFKDVLHLNEHKAIPDQVYLIFELAKHVSSHLLKKGTSFKAGKDASGRDVTYKLEKETSLNKAVVSEIKALFYNKHDIFSGLTPYPWNSHRLYFSAAANSGDGRGGAVTTEDKSWRPFGGIRFPNIGSGTENAIVPDRPEADIGFALTSSNLFLAGGERIITIYLNISKSSVIPDELNNDILYDAFRVMFSGEKKWIEPIWDSEKTTDLDPVVERRIIDFLNEAKSPEDIAGVEPQEGPVFDDPTKGYGDQIRDYDIGIDTAKEILSHRNKLSGKKFSALHEVRAVKYVGEDKINDLIYSFSNPVHSTKIDRKNRQLIIKRTITPAQEPIVAYNKEKLKDPFETGLPVVKILLNHDSLVNPYIYKFLKDIRIDGAYLKVHVIGFNDLIIQNDLSLLDPGKPFQPFGNMPVTGSNFYIGSPEVFQKPVNELKINISWFDLPDNQDGFKGYYKNYLPDKDARKNESFVSDISILTKKRWISLAKKTKLFSSKNGLPLTPKNTITISADNPAGQIPEKTIGNIKNEGKTESFSIYDQNSNNGFIRLTLSGIDFGHKDYHFSYTKAVLNAINLGSTPPVNDYSDDLPNEPYTPAIETLSLDYVATEKIPVADENAELSDNNTNIFHVGPAGVARLKENRLVPYYNDEGELYIGIKDLEPPQNLSVLFQVSEGTSDPDLIPPVVTWHYMSDNKWEKFDKQNILSDSTKGLLTTGVILFDIPQKATKTNTLMPGGLHWLKATVEKSSEGIPHLIDIRSQAAKAVFSDDNNDPGFVATPLKEKTISKLKVSDSAIKKISQPFSSFGGKVAEKSADFYTRVSERLRHKNRAVTIWDYEHLILQNFPSVYKVKCLNHTFYTGTYDSINEAAPGNVSLVIVPEVKNKNAVDPLKPRTSLVTLHNIEEFIKALGSPFINIHVHNPLFEEIQVEFKVCFLKGYDKGIYQVKLENAITRFLSPWAFDSGSDITFGGKVHKSVLLNFVEEQEYVDYITCFRMYHSVPGAPEHKKVDVEEAMAYTSASVLGSAPEHKITVLENDGECSCPDNEVKTAGNAPADDCS